MDSLQESYAKENIGKLGDPMKEEENYGGLVGTIEEEDTEGHDGLLTILNGLVH